MRANCARTILAAIAILAVMFSGNAAANTAVVPVSLQIGTPVTVGDLTLTLLNVSESRCPRTVTCFWEGMVGALVRASAPGVDPTEHVIYTHDKFVMQFTYNGQTVSMVDASPYPETPDPIDPGDYVIRVDVTQDQNVLPAKETSWGRIKALFQ